MFKRPFQIDHSVHVYHHYPPIPEVAAGFQRLEDLIIQVQELIMTALDDQLNELNTGLADVSTAIGKVSADTDNLIAQLANFPPAGLTPEQQAALSAATASVTAIRDSLAALDAKVPDPVAPPTP